MISRLSDRRKRMAHGLRQRRATSESITDDPYRSAGCTFITSIPTVVGPLLEEVGGGVPPADGLGPWTPSDEASDGRPPRTALEGDIFDVDEPLLGPADIEPVQTAADAAAPATDRAFASVERWAVAFSRTFRPLSTAGCCRSHIGSACFASHSRKTSET